MNEPKRLFFEKIDKIDLQPDCQEKIEKTHSISGMRGGVTAESADSTDS